MFVFCTSVTKAEYVTLAIGVDNPTNSIVLVAGENADLIWSYGWPCCGSTSTVNWNIQTPQVTIVGSGSPTPLFRIAGPATISFWMSNGQPPPTLLLTFNKFSASPNTVNVIPRGQGAVVTLQTTSDLNGSWTTLFSQAFTNSTPTNQFFKFTMSAP